MTVPVDLQGLAIVIGAVGTFIVTVGNAIIGWWNARKVSRKTDVNKKEAIAAREAQNEKLSAIAASVDGHATAQEEKIAALHTEVARLQTPGTTTPPTGSDAPVTMDKSGVQVTETEKKIEPVTDA